MKSWLYYMANVWLYLPMRICFRKIYFDKEDNFKKDVPVFLACNHPNSFLDGVVFESSYWRKIYTLARGDAFRIPAVNYIFRSFRLLPIFRATDASAEVARSGNAKTKDELYDHFKKKHAVLIFSEGISYPEKAVRRLKKGTAVIALDTVQKSGYTLDLHIVPTALNYSKFDSYMQTAHIVYGTPIRLLDYADRMKEDMRECVEEITQRIEDHLHANVVTAKGEFESEKEHMHTMLINESYSPFFFIKKNRWKGSIEKLNTASSQLLSEVRSYRAALDAHSLADSNVGGRGTDIVSIIVALLTAFFSLPVFCILALGLFLVNKVVESKVQNVVFKDSFRVGFAMLFGLVASFAAFVYVGYWYTGLRWVALSLIAIYGAICWARLVEALPHILKNIKWWSMAKEKRNMLKTQRSKIMRELS